MASQINPNSIDPTYPVAGVNQSTQGFRSNFLATLNNFAETAAEINDLINKVVVKSALTYGANANINNMGGMPISNTELNDFGLQIYNHGSLTTSATENFDFTLGTFHEVSLAGTGNVTTTVNPTNFPNLGYSELTLYVTAVDSSHNLSFGGLAVQHGNSITGFNSVTNVLTFNAAGPHTLTLGSPDGTNWILTRKNSLSVAKSYVPTSVGIPSDTPGQLAYGNGNIYVCVGEYTGNTSIWSYAHLTTL
jgi:hypothetical protein